MYLTRRLTILGTVAGVIAFCTVFPQRANAQCGLGAALARKATGPAFNSLVNPPQVDLAQPQSESEEHDAEEHRGKPSIAGFWKTVFTSEPDGAVVDVGFDQFHPDGTENAVDSPAPSSGNVCLGVWEKTGPRRYTDVHPSFNWDVASGKVVSIFVERLYLNVSRNGKKFSGTFTWDSYDFSGNPLDGSHVAGTVTGDRITVNDPIPFPFPL
jgi:hypothetical protein